VNEFAGTERMEQLHVNERDHLLLQKLGHSSVHTNSSSNNNSNSRSPLPSIPQQTKRKKMDEKRKEFSFLFLDFLLMLRETLPI